MLTQLLDVFGFLSVLLRGSALVLESLVLGGVLFSLLILKPLKLGLHADGNHILRSCRRFLFYSALALAFVEAAYVAADSAVLAGTTGLDLAGIAGASFFIAGAAGTLAAVVAALITARRSWRPGMLLLIPALVILGSVVATSHAAGRVEDRPLLVTIGALHIAAAASWVGGLPYLLLALARAKDTAISRAVCSRFSNMAMVGVGVLVASGTFLSFKYIDSPAAIHGTAYGVMVASKVVLLGLVLFLGGCNFLLVRGMTEAADKGILMLRRFAEAEVGIGLTVVLAAASLSSQPPAADMTADRVQLAEIGQRFSPQWPRLETPPISALSPPTPLGFGDAAGGPSALQSFVPGATYQPNTPGDIAWSEYNHHWAGVVVLLVGLLAFASQFSGLRWARHWPLAFLGLAAFIFLRADPENWPLGPRSFWQSFAVAEVLQHRLFVVLIIAFAVFEWGVATKRISSQKAALVFPGVCAVGGALLLTHSHALGNIKEELLAELSHVPLAILAVVAGWTRWLELRVPGRTKRVLVWIWPVCFVLIGLVLLNYREA